MSEAPRRYDTHELLDQVGWVRRLARNLVQDSGDAEDLAQETLLAAIDSPPRESAGGLRAWLGTVLRNRARSKWRSDQRRFSRDRGAARAEELPPTDDVLARAETHRRLVDTVFALREPFRTTILLRYFEGLNTEQIARQQMVPQATVRSRLKRALDELRERLDGTYGSRNAWAAPMIGLARLDETAAVAAATAGSAAAGGKIAATTLGGVLMSMKTITLGVAASALIIGGAFFLLPESKPEPLRTGAMSKMDSAGAAPLSDRGGQSATGGDSAVAAGEPPAPNSTVVDHAAVTSTTVVTGGAGSITGTVQDEDGQGLAQIVLHAFSSQRELTEEAFHLSWPGKFATPAVDATLNRAESGRGGSFTIPGLAAGRYSVVARGQGKRQKLVHEIEVRPGVATAIDITLLDGLTIDGIVVDASGNPVANAMVYADQGMVAIGEGGISFLLPASGPGTDAILDGGAVTAESDPRGHFLLEGLAPGNHSLRAEHSAWADAQRSEVAAGSRDVMLRLTKGGAISGTVLGPGGEPIAGAMVAAGEWFGDRDSDGESDSGGRFRIEGIVPGKIRLVVAAEGYPAKQVPGIEVKEGEETREVRVTLDAGATVTGRVLDDAGAPLANASVALGSTTRDLFIPTYHATTSPEGCYRFTEIRAGTTLRGSARHAGFLATPIAEFTAEIGEQELPDITLNTGAVVTGRVVDESGNPIASAVVALRQDLELDLGHAGEMISIETHEIGIELPSAENTTTSAEGEFRIAAIKPGKYRLHVKATEFAPYRGAFFDIAESQAVAAGDIALGRGLRIHGSVVSSAGEPVSGARIRIMEENVRMHFTPPREASTDAEGRFEASGLASGRYDLVASAEGYGSTRVAGVSPGSGALQITLEPAGSLAGVALDATTGSPVQDFYLKVSRGGGFQPGNHFALEFSDLGLLGQGDHFQSPNGEFRKAELAAGNYEVTVRAKGYAPFEQKGVEVLAGKEHLLEVRLDQGGAIEGQLVDHAGEPIEGAAVSLAGDAGAEITQMVMAIAVTDDDDSESITMEFGNDDSVRSGPDGRFLLEGLACGEVTLKVVHKEYMNKTIEKVSVVRKQVENVGRIILGKGSTIFGTVHNAAGRRVDVWIMQAAEGAFPGAPRMTNTDRDGNYSQSGLVPGRYDVSVHQLDADEGMGTAVIIGGNQGPRASVEVGEEERVRQDFTLE